VEDASQLRRVIRSFTPSTEHSTTLGTGLTCVTPSTIENSNSARSFIKNNCMHGVNSRQSLSHPVCQTLYINHGLFTTHNVIQC
jgi:hypothetical protein